MDKKTNRIIALLLILCSFSFPLYTQAQEQKKQNIYFSSTSFSVLLTGGNTKDFSFSMDTVQNLVWDKHKFKLAGQIIYTRSNGEKKSEIYNAALHYNLQLNPRTYFLVLSHFSRNVPSGYNFRFAFSSGAGYTWLASKKINTSTELAFGWSSENNADKLAQQVIGNKMTTIQSNVSSSFISSIMTTKLDYLLAPSTEFVIQETIFLDLREFQRYRLYSYTAISAAINKHFALKTSVQVNYENKPVPGFKNTDLYLLSSIVFKI